MLNIAPPEINTWWAIYNRLTSVHLGNPEAVFISNNRFISHALIPFHIAIFPITALHLARIALMGVSLFSLIPSFVKIL